MLASLSEYTMLPLVLFLFAVIIRRLAARDAVTPFDTYFYLLSTREVRQQGVTLSGELSLPLIPPQKLAVPYLLQWCLGFLPDRVLMKYHPWIGVVADSLFSVAVYYLVIAAGFEAGAALLIFLLYIFCPIMFSRIAIGPRVSSFTPRLFSEIAGNLFVAVLFLPLGLQDASRIGFGATLAALIFLLSKFGLQMLLFVIPIASVIAGDLASIYAVFGGFFIAIILTWGRCIGAFREQLRHLMSYAARNFRGQTAISNRNSLKQLEKYLNEKKLIDSSIGKIIFYFLSSNSFTAVLMKFTAVPVCIVLMFHLWASGESIETWLVAPIAAATIVYLAVNMPKLLFLGEAERYLTHVGLFFLLATVHFAIELHAEWLLFALIMVGMAYWFAEAFLLPHVERDLRARNSEADRLVARLEQESKRRRVLLFPYHAVGVWRMAWQTHCEIIYPIALDRNQAIAFQPYEGSYPYLAIDRLDEMAMQFDIDTLIMQVGSPLPPNFRPSSLWIRDAALSGDHFTIFTRQ